MDCRFSTHDDVVAYTETQPIPVELAAHLYFDATPFS